MHTKIHSSKSVVKRCRWLVALAAGLLVGHSALAAVTFTITPSAVSNTYSGLITLSIGGLTNTETVVVQKFLDANTNGVIDGNDWLVQQFTLQDGTNFVIGGVTNFNVPGDLNATTGAITATLNFQNGDFVQNIIGKYLFKLSSPVSHFAPLTNQFAVTNFPFPQKFTGNVVSNSTSTTLSNAVVLLFPPPKPGNKGPSGPPLAGMVANNAGSYTVMAPAGTYTLVSFRSNFVANLNTSPVLTLAASQTITTNLTLTNATASISGTNVDANDSSIRLPGVMVTAMSTNNLLAISFTDTNGIFNAQVTAGKWKIKVDDTTLVVHGYLGLQNGTNVNAGATGVTIAVPKATALIYGSVKDNLGNPLTALDVYANDQNNNLYQTDGYTDTNGNYVLGVLGLGSSDSWWMQADNNNTLTNYVFSQGNGTININAGQAVLQNFTAMLATNHITGNVKANSTNIVGVGVNASATISNVDYQSHMDTDANGNYSLNVANGTWSISVNCNGGNDSLDNILGSGNYQCPANQTAVINNNTATNKFRIQSCGGVQIFTTSLPNGVVNIAYDQFLVASSCNNNFTWSTNSGTLPPGLQLNSFGELFGTPGANGTFNFSVHVTDGNGSSTNQSLSLTIITPPPLLSTPVKTAGGQLQLSLNGNAGNYYTIEFSTNLVNWVPLLITNPPGAPPLYLDFPTTNKAGFYQAYQSGIGISQSVLSFGTSSAGPPVFYATITNGAGTAVIPITRTSGLSSNVCVNYSTSGGTAIGGCDYTPTSGTLCFAAGVTSSSISIPVSLGCSSTSQSATVNLQLSGPNGSNVLNAVLVIQRPKPVLAFYPTSLILIVPDNCPQTITISNAGPQGSVLNFMLADDGPTGGFLIFNSLGWFVSGSLQAGQTAQVNISIQDQFATNWIGNMSTAPSIYTPGAANFVKSFVSVTIETAQAAAQNLLGTWSGTWSGTNTTGINIPSTEAYQMPVSGTWVLNIQSVDMINNTASGTLVWQGTDAYWTYTGNWGVDGYYLTDVAFHPFAVNQTITFPSDQTVNSQGQSVSLSYSYYGNCGVFSLGFQIGAAFAPVVYEAAFAFGLDVNAKTTTSNCGDFSTEVPISQVNASSGSSGYLTGSQQGP